MKSKASGRGSNKKTLGNSRLLNFTEDSYLERTARPIYAVIFLLPFILFYEYGTFSINTDYFHNSQIRVVAFVWLQYLLDEIGFGGKFSLAAPPLAVIIILISLQITSRKKWNFWVTDYFLMIIECVLLAIPLIVLVLFLSSARDSNNLHNSPDEQSSSQVQSIPVCSSVNDNGYSSQDNADINNPDRKQIMANIVTGIGAGIYEELVFRLILICVLMVIFQDLFRINHTNSIILSVLISAALFSAHHHIDFFSLRPNISDPFNITKFAFRTIAGVYFAFLYAIRGFGITAGTHAFYNIIAVTMKAGFFTHQ